MTVFEAKELGRKKLKSSPSAVLDTSVILQWITGFDKTTLLLKRDFILSPQQESSFLNALEKRETGFPVAYITGTKEFYGFDFFVTPDVLIPKPDSEILVDNALNALAQIYSNLEEKNSVLKKIPLVCDMCCGSGCIGLSVLKSLWKNDGIPLENLPKMTFIDISEKALKICKKNAQNLFDEYFFCKMNFVQSNLFEQSSVTFDLIITNPPYVPHCEAVKLLKDGRSEPLLALDGDVDENGNYSGEDEGLSLIKRLVVQCFAHLCHGGLLIMETGEYNAEKTAQLFIQAGFKQVKIEKDLNGMLRNVLGVKN